MVIKTPRKSVTKAKNAKALLAKAPKTVGKKVASVIADVAADKVPLALVSEIIPELKAVEAPRKSAAKPASKKASPAKARDKTATAAPAAKVTAVPKRKLGIRTAKADSTAEVPAKS